MNLVQKYKNGTLNAKEKKQFLKICLALEVEDFFDWLDDLKITKKQKSALIEITGSHSNSKAFTRLLNATYEPIGWVYDTDYNVIFNKSVDNIKYEKLLSNIGITPSKIDDLFVSLSFNISNDIFDGIDENLILSRFTEIPILKSSDFFIAN